MKLCSYQEKKLKILLVEDDEIAQVAIKSIIENTFCSELDIVETGLDALRLIEKNDYDLFFLDLGLLESDGFRITQSIRSRLDYKKNIPIIGITAFLDEPVKKCCLKVGMDYIFAKPLTVDDCKIIIKKYFQD